MCAVSMGRWGGFLRRSGRTEGWNGMGIGREQWAYFWVVCSDLIGIVGLAGERCATCVIDYHRCLAKIERRGRYGNPGKFFCPALFWLFWCKLFMVNGIFM